MRFFNRPIISSTLDFLIPWRPAWHANKIVTRKIDHIVNNQASTPQLDYMKGYEKLTIDEVKEFFAKTIDTKKSLEDKLKTSLLSVTVGISVLGATTTLTFNDSFLALHILAKLAVFLTTSIAVLYFLLAAVFAMQTISGRIAVYQPFPEELGGEQDGIKKSAIAQSTELNSLTNIVRQNFMSVSFQCIVNGLFVLALFLFSIGGSSILRMSHKGELMDLKDGLEVNKNHTLELENSIREFHKTHSAEIKSLSSDSAMAKGEFETLSNKISAITRQADTDRARLVYLESQSKKAKDVGKARPR